MCKVLIFSRDANWLGGVVNFIDLLIKNLPQDVKVFSFRIGQRKGVGGYLARYFMPVVDAFKLSFLLLHNKFDAYHLNPSLDGKSLARDGIFLLILKIFKAKNVIVAFHGWSIKIENIIASSKVYKFLFKFLFKGATTYLVLADPFKKWLVNQTFPEENILLYTTMFEGEKFANLHRNTDGKRLRVLFLSRLVREKGIYELIDAINILSKDYPDILLTIAGDGPEKNNIKKYINNMEINKYVQMPGYIRGSEKISTLLNSDIFVLPSYYGEGCPVSLLEAMAAGLPAITSPVGAIPDIILNRKNGLIIDEISSKEIAEAIDILIKNEPLRVAMGKQNRIEAWKKYNAPAIAYFFCTLYKRNLRNA